MFSPFLNSRYIIDMQLIPKAPIHIGAGGDGTFKTIVLMSVRGTKVPIIPAESLKGALRSITTRIAKSSSYPYVLWKYFDVNNIVKSHKKDQHKYFVEDLRNKLSGELREKDLRDLLENTGLFSKMQVKTMVDELSYADALEILASMACPICQLFGSRHVAGKLLIEDAVIEGDLKKLKIETQTCIAISRKTRTAEEGRLFMVQFLDSANNVRFRTKIVADNIEKGGMDANLLARLLIFLRERGLALGGCKSKGFGLFDIKVDLYRMDFAKPSSKDDVEVIMKNVDALLMKNVSKIRPEDLLEIA